MVILSVTQLKQSYFHLNTGHKKSGIDKNPVFWLPVIGVQSLGIRNSSQDLNKTNLNTALNNFFIFGIQMPGTLL